MFLVLIVIYRQLSMHEERAVATEFGAAWDDDARRTPRFIPRLSTDHDTYRPSHHDTPVG
jgi:protein-S-isoprenylcysteine O-methyltransferase Ste14